MAKRTKTGRCKDHWFCIRTDFLDSEHLWLFPLLIGKVLDKTNVGVTDPTKLNYTAPLIMLAGLGVIALFIGLALKVVDKKRHLGLEEPNIKE